MHYEQYQQIRFRNEAALWFGSRIPFEAQVLLPGMLHRHPVNVFVVEGDEAWPLHFSMELFRLPYPMPWLLAAGESIEGRRGLALLLGTLLILLAPKLIGIARLAFVNGAKHHGGRIRLLGSALLEIMLSSIIAPIQMVQQVIAVLRVFCGIDGGWRPQRFEAVERPWFTYLQFHAVETALGLALVTCIITGLLTWWLWPVAASLFLAAPISRWTSVPMAPKQSGLLATPEDIVQPVIIAQSYTNAQRIAEAAEAAAAPLELLEAAE